MKRSSNSISVVKSALYRIKVRGKIPDSWYDRLGGLQISAKTSNNVTLEGWLPDQAALAGVLDAFYTLHLPLLEVICLQYQADEPECI